jgi:hypothetical protein
MAKRIRLIDEPEVTEALADISSGLTSQQSKKALDYLEAIDWKLWQLLKIVEKQVGE